ncbi:30S ribosomal protein S8 [Methanolapillus millepedarum]|uniref:Small ribosomal subunit protein uS8 n=1 Tax=Methanolapillus millepedarum TaxID=3028296 RepID=A0AA96V3Q8_9EURY|nr:30S ribosomal protein S8 [Methanosarcinaceae archaeon Ac7]
MVLFDPLADALSVIKNAENVGKTTCVIRPASKIIGNVLNVMKEGGYIESFEFVEDGKAGVYEVKLAGSINDCGAIKPRYSIGIDGFEKWEKEYLPAKNFGVLVLTTSLGVLSHNEAREKNVGGKLLAYVY